VTCRAGPQDPDGLCGETFTVHKLHRVPIIYVEGAAVSQGRRAGAWPPAGPGPGPGRTGLGGRFAFTFA